MRKIITLSFLLLAVGLVGCEKEKETFYYRNISGEVKWEYYNNTHPVDEVQVKIYPIGDPSAAQTQLTNEDGQYAFKELLTGDYQITFSKEGYMDKTDRLTVEEYSNDLKTWKMTMNDGPITFSDPLFEEYLAGLEGLDLNHDGKISKLEASFYNSSGFPFIIDRSCKAKKIDGLAYFVNLDQFQCPSNSSVESIDLTGCHFLEQAFFTGNRNQTELILSGCTGLTLLECNSCKIKSLDVSDCVKLKELTCEWNSLEKLLVPKNSESKELTIDCSNNKLTTLDLSKCANLKKIECAENKIKKLDFTACTNLIKLDCARNLLEELNVSGCMELDDLFCGGNNNLPCVTVTSKEQWFGISSRPSSHTYCE